MSSETAAQPDPSTTAARTDRAALNDMAWYPHEDPDVQISEISADGVVGFHLVPHQLTRAGAIITTGGSEGSPDFFTALDLARAGHECFAVFFWGQQGQPEHLQMVPLEEWKAVTDHVRQTASDASSITAIGTSKGAEFLLAATSEFDNVDHLVLIAPTAHRWPGLAPGPEHSSWTLHGAELPCVTFRSRSLRALPPLARMMLAQVRHRPVRLLPLYEAALAAAPPAVEQAACIDASRISADVLLFAGTDDQMWPSASEARIIAGMRTQPTELVEAPDAGHMVGGPTDGGGFLLGGTPEANDRAAEQRQAVLTERLATWNPVLG